MIPLPEAAEILPDADAVAEAAAERLVALCAIGAAAAPSRSASPAARRPSASTPG